MSGALQREKARRSCHWFLFESGVTTKDEHDVAHPIKTIPDIPYLRCLVDCLLVSGRLLGPMEAQHAREAGIPGAVLELLRETGILLVEKSRDMFVTNIICAYLLWRGRAVEHQLILVQSKKFEDAASLVFQKEPQFARLSGMEQRLPEDLRQMEFPRAGSEGHLYVPNGSHFRAIPEGAHVIRSEHPSVIFSDEAAFQPEFGLAYTAALPAVEGGGQLVAASSAEPGEFQELVEAEKQETQPTRIPGLGFRLAAGHVPVLRVHYAADPAKRPGTLLGDDWRRRAAGRYIGGTRSPRWRKEMEIEWKAFSGVRPFPDWDVWSSGPPFVLEAYDARGCKLFGSYDHGWTNPSAYHVHAIDRDGQITTVWEFYADRVPYREIARIIKGERVVSTADRREAKIEPDRRVFEGNPFAGEELWRVADPSLWAEDAPMKDEPNKSLFELFRREGVLFHAGERGGDLTVAEWLLGWFWADPAQPKYRITRACRWLIWEIGRQRFREVSAHLQPGQNSDERLVDKDNHAWDGLKMFLKKFPPAAIRPTPPPQGGSFNWFREQARRAQRGRPPQSWAIRGREAVQ